MKLLLEKIKMTKAKMKFNTKLEQLFKAPPGKKQQFLKKSFSSPLIPLKEISSFVFTSTSDVQTQALVYLPAIELLPVDFPQTCAVLSTFRFSLLPDHPMLVTVEE